MSDIHDLVAPYALDALDPEEAREFEAHLRTCEACRADLVQMREGAADVAASASTAPPPALKSAVMEAIGDTPAPVTRLEPRRSPIWLAAAAAAAVVAIVFAGLWMTTSTQLDQAELIAAVYEAPDATFAGFETSHGPVRFAYSPSLRRGVLNGGQLDDLSDDDLYQLWLIDDRGPVSAGTLRPGDSDVLVESVEPGQVLAMTVEDSPGVDAPTRDPLFAAEL